MWTSTRPKSKEEEGALFGLNGLIREPKLPRNKEQGLTLGPSKPKP